MYANANMAGTRIVCPIYMFNLGGARSNMYMPTAKGPRHTDIITELCTHDLVVRASGFGISEPGSIPGWAPNHTVFLFFFLQVIMLNCFLQVI